MSTRSSSGYSGKPGAEIQPCGFLLALDPEWRIAFASVNVGDFFTDSSHAAAGQPLSRILGEAGVHALRNQLALLRYPGGIARVFSLALNGAAKRFDIAMHQMGDTILLEAFPGASEPGDPIGMVRALATGLDRHAELADLARDGARQLRALTGYERVAIFRAGDDGQATLVVHEARGEHPDPAPPVNGARLRMVGDVGSSTVAVAPTQDDELLGDCLLRSPDAAETAEFEDWGAAAGLTMPLRSGDRDWGIALCLHSSPKRPMLDRIAAAELFGDLLAMRAELCALRS